MRATLSLLALLASLTLCAHSPAYDDIRGGESGNGGDSKPMEHGSAWFLGPDKTIRVCLEISSGFSVSESEIRDTITEVFLTWKRYYNDKKIAQHILNPLFQPSFNILFLDSCDETEDLKFYFGVTNTEVENAKKEYYKPIGFAHRSSYDLDLGWGKGFVWTAPRASEFLPWDFPHRLHGILLHEVGHVLGCEHVRGTIMTENISRLIHSASQSPENVKKLLATIDGEVELKIQLNDVFEYDGKISHWDDEVAATFRLFTGREPSGKVSAHIHQELPNGILTLLDEKGKFELPFHRRYHLTSFETGTKIFKAVRTGEFEGKKYTEGEWTSGGDGKVWLGEIRSVAGVTYPMVLTRSSGEMGSPAEIRYLISNHPKDLFVSIVPSKEGMGEDK